MIKKLKELNGFIKFVLNTAFETNYYFFTEKDKMAIKSYRENIFEKSIDNMAEVSEFQELLNIISKIRKFGLRGRIEDTEFIEKLFPKEYILEKIEKHVENVYLSKNKLNIEEVKKLDNILITLINEKLYITNVLERAIILIEESGVDISDTSFSENFMQKFNEMYTIVRVDDFSNINFEFAYKYLNLSTAKKEFNIFNNQAVADLLQIVERLPEKNREKIHTIINKNFDFDNVNLVEVRERVETFTNREFNNICMNEKEFDVFLKDIQILKLSQNFRMDSKVIYFMLKQFLSNEGVVANNKRKYFGLLLRTLEDISYNDLNGVCTFFRKDYSQKMSAAQTFKIGGVIILDEKAAENLLESKNLYVIHSIYHENTHITQYMEIERISNLSENSLRTLQFEEEIIKKYNPQYYIANYLLMFQEIEAREKGNLKLLELINQLNISELENIKKDLQKEIAKEQENYSLGRNKKKAINSEETIDVKQYMKELIKAHPEILSEYPILLQEYKSEE